LSRRNNSESKFRRFGGKILNYKKWLEVTDSLARHHAMPGRHALSPPLCVMEGGVPLPAASRFVRRLKRLQIYLFIYQLQFFIRENYVIQASDKSLGLYLFDSNIGVQEKLKLRIQLSSLS
jgi:hypothetical protein